MRARASIQIVAAVVVAMIGYGAGCGDNSNNDNTSTNPRPTKTAQTVVPTATKVATPVVVATPTTVPTAGPGQADTVTFTANSSAQPPLQGFTINVTYPTAKGGFRGSADSVACTSNAPNFTPNDKDNGSLIFVSATTSGITFPVTITCTFDVVAGQSLSVVDLQAVVTEVTQNNAEGDTSSLSVAIAVTPS